MLWAAELSNDTRTTPLFLQAVQQALVGKNQQLVSDSCCRSAMTTISGQCSSTGGRSGLTLAPLQMLQAAERLPGCPNLALQATWC